ncbi:MAG: porin [Myxococcota bacterium]
MAAGVHAQPEALGPVRFGDENASLQVGYRLQLQADIHHGEDESDGEVRIRRSRLVLTGRFLKEALTFRLHANLAPGALEIMDVWLRADTQRAAFLLGYNKIPFGHRWSHSSGRLTFVDWPIAVTAFGGRALQLTAFDPKSDAWAIGVTTGQAARPSNGQELPAVYGEAPRNFLSLTDADEARTPHPELVGRLRVQGDAGTLSISALWDLIPEHRFDDLLRLGVETEHRFRMFRVWTAAFLSMSETQEGDPIVAMAGVLIEIEALISRWVHVGLRYSSVQFTEALLEDARSHALQRLAINPDSEGYESVGDVSAEHELVAAISAMWLGHSLKWVNDVAWLRTAGVVASDELRVRSQVQILF